MRHNPQGRAPWSGLDSGLTKRRDFLTRLPLALCIAANLAPRAAALVRGQTRYQRGTASNRLIYVVDDNVDLTWLYRRFLEGAGFEVKTFADRAEALRDFLAAGDRPGLLITDYHGFPISAEELLLECRRAQPDLKILMASGCPECCVVFGRVHPDRFLGKPFTMERFLAEVNALVQSPRA